MQTLTTNSGVPVSYRTISNAVDEPYAMDLAGEDANWVVRAVNQGIDSRLEAAYIPAAGDSYVYQGGRDNWRLTS